MEIAPILLILHMEKSSFSVGQSVFPEIQIVNRSTRPVVFDKGFIFDGENMAFSEPNLVHLEGASGVNLFLPYQRKRAFFKKVKPLSIQAGGEEWFFLPVSMYHNFQKPGKYIFRVRLAAGDGSLFTSNTIQFEITDIESNVSREKTGDKIEEKIELKLRPLNPVYKHGRPVEMEVSFKNNSGNPLIFLLPQEDSLDGWVNPVYLFTVTNADGRTLPRPLRSGSMATPLYDEKSKVSVEPGYAQKITIRLLPFVEMKSKGVFRVRLTYIVRDHAVGKGGVLLDEKMNWDKDMFVGKLDSEETSISIV